jgi:hypothetical protein
MKGGNHDTKCKGLPMWGIMAPGNAHADSDWCLKIHSPANCNETYMNAAWPVRSCSLIIVTVLVRCAGWLDEWS